MPFVAVGDAREVNLLVKKPMVHHDVTILTMYPAIISAVNNCSEYRRQVLEGVSVDQFVPFLWPFVDAEEDVIRLNPY